jgi:large-conductance mechanosensitive channel
MSANATAVMGLLVGFLVVGVIGVYIGDQMIQAANLSESDTLYSAQDTVISTFTLGVTLCKVVVIVSVASIVFMLLQSVGLIPRVGGGGGGL